MNLLSIISIVACVVYLYVGFHAFLLQKSKINLLFLLLCSSFAIWSFAYAFVYVTDEAEAIWMEISAIGWCTFSSIALHLVLLITDNKIIKNKMTLIMLYTPSVLFFYMAVFLFWKDSRPSPAIEAFFYCGDFVYHFSFLISGILLIVVWGTHTNSIRKKKQARILVITSICPFLLNLITQHILPMMGVNIPLMGHVFSLIMITGTYYAIIEYRLFSISPKIYVDEILQEMMDLVVVATPDGKIIKVNNNAEKLLGYTKEQLYGKPLDYIMQKEVAFHILNRVQNSELYRFWEVYFIKKNQGKLPVNITCSFIIDEKIGDTLGLIVVGNDITLMKKLKQEVKEHKEAKEQIQYMAEHDSLTGLANRKRFYQLLQNAVERGHRTGEQFAVLFLDLDDLKLVNDTYGHEAGDALLYTVGERIKGVIEKEHFAARIGGDEFTFLITSIDGKDDAKAAAEKIIDAVNRPIYLGGKTFNVRSSMGISIFPHDGRDGSELVKKADMEMYQVKSKKKTMS